jgi:transposase InsO family protein
MESFFGTLKQELVYPGFGVYQEQFVTRDEAKAKIFKYIEVFYNPARGGALAGGLTKPGRVRATDTPYLN